MPRLDTVIFEAGESMVCEIMLASIANKTFPELLQEALAEQDR